MSRERGARDLYFIQNPRSGLLKIGISGNVERRLRQLECAAGQRLHLAGVIRKGAYLEQPLLDLFWSRREHGEWVTPSRELLLLALYECSRECIAYLELKIGDAKREDNPSARRRGEGLAKKLLSAVQGAGACECCYCASGVCRTDRASFVVRLRISQS
jgi:hypothetical protein